MEHLEDSLALIRSHMSAFKKLLYLNNKVMSHLKSCNREMLSWPQPFIMTNHRLKIIERQQICQNYPDQVNNTLRQVISQLNGAIQKLDSAHLISRG